MHVLRNRALLTVEPGSKLAGLRCRVCHCPVRPGECVLVAYRRGQPSLIHAHVCGDSPSGGQRKAARTQRPT